jgi:hypothetical protein
MTLKTLADVRELIGHLPPDRRKLNAIALVRKRGLLGGELGFARGATVGLCGCGISALFAEFSALKSFLIVPSSTPTT